MLEGWQRVKPGGDTLCSDGSPYSFYLRKGASNRVVVHFEGGGACWDHESCSLPGLAYTPEVSESAFPFVGALRPSSIQGTFNQTKSESLFKDWTMLFVPYCTGDIHWGAKDTTYYSDGVSKDPKTIRHHGAANARAALNFLYAAVPSPEKVFVTGESAGGYGAALWAPYIRKQYAAPAQVYQLSDSSAGVLADGFFTTLQSAWNFQALLPSFVPAFSDPTKVDSLAKIFNGIGAYEGNALKLNMYNTSYDETQILFYAAQADNVTPQLWNTKMREQVANIQAASPTFRALTAANYVHTILTSNAFYTQKTNGVTMHDWVSDMVNDVALSNVDCKTTNTCGTAKQP